MQLYSTIVAEEDGVWADGAYTGAGCRKVLEAKAVEGQIFEKGNRAGLLNDEQKARNRLKSKVRARGDHPVAFITCSMAGVSFIGLILRRLKVALAGSRR